MFTPSTLTLRYILINATHQNLTFITGCAQGLQNMNALLTKKTINVAEIRFRVKEFINHLKKKAVYVVPFYIKF